MIEYLLAIGIGILAGTITGLIPGIHVNLLSVMLISLSATLLQVTTPTTLAVFIIAMAVTHTFVDSIPSIFLGAPDPDMALGVLPGHRMLLEGKGYEAVKLTVIGSFLALLATAAIIPIMIPVVPKLFEIINPYIGHILAAVVIFMILNESSLNAKVWATFVFAISGVLGIFVLSYPNLNQPLFPMLSGLFGVSTLLVSLNEKTTIPKQYITESIVLKKSDTTKAIIAAVGSGSLTGMMPGLGSAQAAIIAMQVARNLSVNGFMVLIGGINTVNFTFSLVTLFTLEKARNGAIVAVLQLLESITFQQFLLFTLSAIITGCIAAMLTLKLAKIASKAIAKVNYQMLCITIIILITAMAIYFSGAIGLLILVTATAIGILPPLLQVKRSMAMGCLLLPVILFFLL